MTIIALKALAILIMTVAIAGLVAGISPILPALISVTGTAVVALLVYRAGQAQNRITNTLDAHREYYNHEFAESRQIALQFFRVNAGRPWSKTNPYDVPDPGGLLKGYSEVLRYFHRLALLWEHNRIEKPIVGQMFAREMGYWMGVAFDPMKEREDWWTKSMIFKLSDDLRASKDGQAAFQDGFSRGKAALAREATAKEVAVEEAKRKKPSAGFLRLSLRL
jgi:hypothetical protein